MRKLVSAAVGLFIGGIAMGALVASPAQAAPLFGAEYGGYGVYSINAATGAAVSIGAATDNTPGLAYNGLTGTMYVNSVDNLYTMDTSNAALSLVGNFGTSLTGLTFGAGFSSLYAITSGGSSFYSIDPLTGAATFVGATGVTSAVFDLATDSSGTIYAAGTGTGLYTIDPLTGAATSVATLTNASQSGVTSISFDENDVLYGIETVSDALVTIDIGTGTVTTVGGDIGNDLRGLAFAIDATPVPEPAPLALLGIGVVALGFVRRRRPA